MTRLEESLHGWAIKPGHYDDDFPGGGGSSAQVFEVTNLVIPSGTDWSSFHMIDSFEIPALSGLMIAAAIDATVTDPDAVSVRYRINGINAGGYESAASANQGTPIAGITEVISPTQYLASDSTTAILVEFGFGAVNGNDGSPTTAPITVVRARAAFLVI